MQRQRDAETVCENKNVGIVGQKKNVGHIVGILEKCRNCRNCRTSVSPAIVNACFLCLKSGAASVAIFQTGSDV